MKRRQTSHLDELLALLKADIAHLGCIRKRLKRIERRNRKRGDQ